MLSVKLTSIILLATLSLINPTFALPKGGGGGKGGGRGGGGRGGDGPDVGGSLLDFFTPTGGGKKSGVHCGTTDDANLDDCKFLTDPKNWGAAFAGNNNKCHYTNPFTREFNAEAYNVGCHGECCVYVARIPSDQIQDQSESIRSIAAGLMGCADTSKGKVNAVNQLENGIGICVSNGHGCGDCFDDSDFS
ncbi:hypothetical protein VKT23_011911 [Stygiomarasmius scandens]|uniref:Uncharacterized protein n=1 Tax=Marasmiellus scandens TaxID=2682957 RepID=A0ABR1J7T4_9AGAR